MIRFKLIAGEEKTRLDVLPYPSFILVLSLRDIEVYKYICVTAGRSPKVWCDVRRSVDSAD